MQHIEWVRIVWCVLVLDGEGTWVYNSVSTALVVVNTDSFVSPPLQWLCDQFLWLIFATLYMSHWFEKWDFTCRAHFSSECQFLKLSVRAVFHQLFIILFFFRPKIVFWLNPWSLLACIAEMAEQLTFSCLGKAVVEEEKNSMEREREHAHKMERIKGLVYNRPNLIRSQVGSVSTFGCMLQFHIFFFLQLMCVYSVQCRQKVKLSNANVHSSIIVGRAWKRETESAIIMCVFSLVLAYVSGYIFVCICMFMYVYVFAKGCIFCGKGVGLLMGPYHQLVATLKR